MVPGLKFLIPMIFSDNSVNSILKVVVRSMIRTCFSFGEFESDFCHKRDRMQSMRTRVLRASEKKKEKDADRKIADWFQLLGHLRSKL
jgi:hypothetical protein